MKKNEKIIKVPLIGNMASSVWRTLFGIVLGLAASGILILLSGVNPFAAYGSMLRGAFGSLTSFSNVLVRSSPLILGGLGVALGIKAGVWNTGMEGYMYLGAVGAALVGLLDLNLPAIVYIPLCMICAMLMAALWGLIPAVLRAYRGVNEVTCTIMMSYIAIYLVNWLVSYPELLGEEGSFFPMSRIFANNALLPILMKGTSLHPGAFIGIALCLLFAYLLKNTSFGFRTQMLGANPNAAEYAGVDSKKQIVMVLVIGAILGGLAGSIEVMGLKRRVYMEFVDGIGYESVAVALLAGGNPIGVIVSAFFFAILKVGGATMSIETGISSSMTEIIISLCVIFVIGVGVEGAIRTKKKSKAAAKAEKTETEKTPEKKEDE